jgi:hypothetical protein
MAAYALCPHHSRLADDGEHLRMTAPNATERIFR